jgi:predicted esterase
MAGTIAAIFFTRREKARRVPADVCRFFGMPEEHHIRVTRSARYFALGKAGTATRDVWFCCHGYGQLASEFASEFECIDAPERLIVVPEALSRFYIQEGPGFHGPNAKVGATWMTREDREHEIADYISYLDELHEEIFKMVERANVRVTVLGFSQGGATVNRWLVRGSVRADRLIMWGSLLASDIDLVGAAKVFQKLDLKIVYGKRDQFANADIIAKYEATLKGAEIPYELTTFEGGHRLDRDTLTRLAAKR